MAKQVKVRAYKKLSPTGKIENVDAHMRKIESAMKKIGAKSHVDSGDTISASVDRPKDWYALHKKVAKSGIDPQKFNITTGKSSRFVVHFNK